MKRALFALSFALTQCRAAAPVTTVTPTVASAGMVAAVVGPMVAPAVAMEPEPAGQLPVGVEPLHYDLELEIVPTRERFSGVATIRIRTTQPRDGIWLHGEGLDVTSVEVGLTGTPMRRARWEPGTRAGINAVRWDSPLQAGEIDIRLRWTAPFNRQLEGLYRVDSGGDSYAFTQFEAISARKAFPGCDEPRVKTPFDMTVVVAGDDKAITNTLEVSSTPRVGSTPQEHLRAIRFATTERLPTYLLAYAVGPLDVVEAPPIAPNEVRTRAIPLRGVAARGRGGFLQRGLTDTGPLIAMMERYFARGYPYPKLDLIAVPDFGAGAMENAGAITFRESLLLVRPDAPPDQLRNVDHVLAHELAHHWFGNLVTLQWWDDIWLNESFATWMGTKATDEVFPQHRQGMALLAGVHNAMNADALRTAVPILRPIQTDSDLRGGSSAIVYQKGASVLRMLERWLGPMVFRDALRGYLRAHEHSTATGADLFRALQQSAQEKPVEATVRGFVQSPGVPMVGMDLACESGVRRLVITQSRFNLPAGTRQGSGDWRVPVCVRLGNGTQPPSTQCGMAAGPLSEIQLGQGACPTWFMPNADAGGYYRWAMSPAALATLISRGWTQLTPAEKLSVVNNARALYTQGSLDFAPMRTVLERAASDADRFVVLEPIATWARIIEESLEGPAAAAARAAVVRLYQPTWRGLGWSPRPGEDAERALLRRELAVFLALVLNDSHVLSEGSARGERWVSGARDGVAPELIGPIVAMFVRSQSARAAPLVIAQALASDDAVMRARLLGALGHATEPSLTSAVLPLSIDPRLRVNEVFVPFDAALSRAQTRSAAFGYLATNADQVFARISLNGRSGTPWLGARFCRAEDRPTVNALFAPRIAAIAGSASQLEGALEAIGVCSAERDRHATELARAFHGR